MAITISGNGIVEGNLANGAVTNAKLATDSVNSAELVNGAVDNSHLATGIDATKLADGTITNSELQYINSLSSNAQTQISAAGAQTYRSQFTVDRTTTGTQAITGVGFAPKAVFALATRNCVRGYSTGQAAFTGNGHGCMFGDYASVSGSMALDNYLYRNDGNGSSTATSIIAYGKISSWDSDGFTITKTKSGAPTSNLIVYYTCIG